MIAKIELSEAAERVLMSADLRRDRWFINRTLGMKTWGTRGEAGARKDIAELYRHGLIKEWFSPLGPPVFLTPAGIAQLALRKGDA